jgi:hypothetical protein
VQILFFNKHNKDISGLIDADVIKAYKIKVSSSKNYLSFRNELSKSFSGETIIVFFIEDSGDLNFIEKNYHNFIDIKLIIKSYLNSEQYSRRILNLNPRMIVDSLDIDNSELKQIIAGIIKEFFKKNNYRGKK